jgi:hypothetical protein
MMTKNTKIALGCGGGGCLGLILLVIVCAVLVVTGVVPAPGLYNPGPNRNYNSNYNTNSNSNSNSNDNLNTNSDTPSSSSSMSDDNKHRLFQAGAASGDPELNRKVWQKLGFLKANGSLNEDYGPFVKEHFGWIFKNTDFIQTINTKEKARAYVEEHIDD